MIKIQLLLMHSTIMETEERIKKLLKIPVYLTLLMIIAKFIVYSVSGSLSILSLFADSFFDFISSLISLTAYKYSKKSKTDKYQYGFYGIIDITTIIISMMILSTSSIIIYKAIFHILNKNTLIYDLSSVLVMTFSSLISIIVAISLKATYKKTKLLVIKSEIAHYSADGITNFSVLVSIIICKYIYNSYLIDPIIAIIMAFIIGKPAIEILIEAINNIMSKEIDDDIKTKIINIITTKSNVIGYDKFKTRRSGERIFIQMHLKINKDLSFEKVHNIVHELEEQIEHNIDNSEVIIHACPK